MSYPKLLLALIICAICAAIIHLQWRHMKEAEARNVEIAKAEAEQRRLSEEEKRAAAARPIMAIAKIIEPYLYTVPGRLDLNEPRDLVPPLEITKERILDRRARAQPDRLVVFDRATSVLNFLTRMGEERTRTLEEMLKNKARTSTSLDAPKASFTSGDFFNRSVEARWDAFLTKSRPTLKQLMDDLRSAEREWNKTVAKGAPVETYDLPTFEPVLITVTDAQNTSSLSNSRNGDVSRPWRTGYYTRYGSRLTY